MDSFEETFEARVANYYLFKIRNARERGIEFSLSLMSFRNLMRTKYCYYTGVKLTFPPVDEDGRVIPGHQKRHTDISIERLDNHLGYVPGNVKACSLYANSLKAVWEDPGNIYERKHFERMLRVIKKNGLTRC